MAFLNTKSDLGPCPCRYHEDSLRDKYRLEGERYRAEYEREFYSLLDRLVSELERKLRRGKDRVDTTKPNDPSIGTSAASDELEEKLTLLDLQIKEKLALVEAYGEQGRIMEAQNLMIDIDMLKGEVERLRATEADNPLFRLEKRMEVCQTCGALLIVGDAQKRIEAHYEGRQHTGWARIRQSLDEFKRRNPTFHFSQAAPPRRAPPAPTFEPPRFHREQHPPRDPSRPEPRSRSRDHNSRDHSSRDHNSRDYNPRDYDQRTRDHHAHQRDSRDYGHQSSNYQSQSHPSQASHHGHQSGRSRQY